MCGIVGNINWGDRHILTKMSRTLIHRGPDSQGVWEKTYSDNTWIGLGHCRLGILDLSLAGHQPMSNENGRLWIVCNGEIYNYRELRKELIQNGHCFKSASDTEVILHLYEEYGIECLQHLRGMFAFAIWDCQRRELFVARDRLGIKPLYYTERGNRLLFASEIKALLKHPDIDRQLDYQALDDYLTYLYIPPPRTIFKSIQKLPPGHYLTWRDGAITAKTAYWTLPEQTIVADEREIAEELHDLLEESVRLRMVSDVPIGAFLSGGLDSSSIVGLMSRHSSRPIKTFSIGFDKRARLYNELEYARKVSQHFGTDHHEIIVEPNSVKLLPEIVESFDEPFGNPTAVLVRLLSEFTRQHVTVALAGDGGDELFGGYPRYKGAVLSKTYRKIPAKLRQMTLEKVAGLVPESSRGRHGARRFKEFVLGNSLSAEDMYCSWVTYYSEDMKRVLFSERTQGQIGEKEPYQFLKMFFREAIERGKSDFFDQVTSVDLQSFLPCNLLAYTDRMSMAHALEVRVPFTDHKVVEFVAQLPAAIRFKGMRSKYILKKTIADLLPKEVLKRRKLGLNPPLALWLKEDLKDLVGDCLNERTVKSRGYFHYEAIDSMLASHASGKRDLSLQIWSLIVFEIWHRKYID